MPELTDQEVDQMIESGENAYRELRPILQEWLDKSEEFMQSADADIDLIFTMVVDNFLEHRMFARYLDNMPNRIQDKLAMQLLHHSQFMYALGYYRGEQQERLSRLSAKPL